MGGDLDRRPPIGLLQKIIKRLRDQPAALPDAFDDIDQCKKQHEPADLPALVITTGGRGFRGAPPAAYLTATMTSISTGIPPGSELIPTTERACRPRSPNTSTNRSEQPLTTFGWSSKSGAALTIPSTLTTSSTRSRSP